MVDCSSYTTQSVGWNDAASHEHQTILEEPRGQDAGTNKAKHMHSSSQNHLPNAFLGTCASSSPGLSKCSCFCDDSDILPIIFVAHGEGYEHVCLIDP